MEEQRAKLNQMECNMKAPNVKKINLKHQTTSVDLKVTFLEEKKNTHLFDLRPIVWAAPYQQIVHSCFSCIYC